MNIVRLLCCLLLASVLCTGACGQVIGSASLPSIQLMVAQAVEHARSQNEANLPLLLELQTRLFTLERELIHRQLQVSRDYEITFEAFERTLQRLSTQPANADASATLKALSADLALKIGSLAGSAGGIGVRPAPVVTVAVITTLSANPAPGYRVTFNSVANVSGKPPTHPVASDTNNAIRTLPPGLYTLEIYRGEKRIHAREVDIGSVNKTNETITIDVAPFN